MFTYPSTVSFLKPLARLKNEVPETGAQHQVKPQVVDCPSGHSIMTGTKWMTSGAQRLKANLDKSFGSRRNRKENRSRKEGGIAERISRRSSSASAFSFKQRERQKQKSKFSFCYLGSVAVCVKCVSEREGIDRTILRTPPRRLSLCLSLSL